MKMKMITTSAMDAQDRARLVDRLVAAQNSPRNMHRDILTFAGFLTTTDELLAYVERHERATGLLQP